MTSECNIRVNEEPVLTRDEIKKSKITKRRKKRLLLLFVAPLLVFVIVSFVIPIANMLYRSVYSPAVAELIPLTVEALESWDASGDQLPNNIVPIFTKELQQLAQNRHSGKLAKEINRLLPGSGSLIKSTARKFKKLDIAMLPKTHTELAEVKRQWADINVWRSIKKSGATYTSIYYLAALDLEHNTQGEVVARDTQVYIQLYVKSLKTALYITLATLLIGYPLSYYMATLPDNKANVMMVFVLLPFWTSLLVRTTSWIALLQTNGIVNSVLQALHIISEPLEMLYTQFATVVAMVHILLPFMILPLYSVMKGVDPSYMRAAMSLGAKPLSAFVHVYFPMTIPGLAAGSLLVFIISIGYYITPALVGGTDGQMVSNIIAFHMQSSNNWELAAALGSLLLALILLMYAVYDRLVGISNLKLG